MTLDSDAAQSILANAIEFAPSVLLHGKNQVFWDLQSYLHIVIRHIDAYQVGNFKGKTVLPYELTDLKCLVSCDHIPRRSMALFRAKAVLDELIGGLPPRSSHRLQHIA